jgi:hypothetical protein
MGPDGISIHGPLFVNAVCHGIGVLVFGLLSFLFAVDYQRTRAAHHLLPAVASALALLWNLGSVIVLARGPVPDGSSDLLIAFSFSVLTILPAVLLHIAVGMRERSVVFAGYALTTVSVVLHWLDAVTGREVYHVIAISCMSLGFASLTLISLILEIRRGPESKAQATRLATSMCLFLMAMSFLHLGSGEARHAWSSEIILHHAGIPLALFVLLQDYRFLMLDAFLRVLSTVGLAAGAVYCALVLERTTGILGRVQGKPVSEGLLILGACLGLALFAVARNALQGVLTRVVFGRRGTELAIVEVRRLRTECANQQDYLRSAAGQIAKFMEAERVEVSDAVRQEWLDAAGPFAPSDFQVWRSADSLRWVYAVVPVRLASDRMQFILLGTRRGNRRYLSEDFTVLARMAQAISDEIARYEALEMQALVSEAELRALQAQINPHFLFNALNTLFGTIDRENSEARRLVLNLADVLRHALGSGERYVSLEEEIRIVKAYLEIERLRLGPKLETEICVDSEALAAKVPVLSIQPLVENAVKHGVANNPRKGYVRLIAKKQEGGVHIEIANSGELAASSKSGGGSGVGLKNVRRRLSLCFGSDLSLSTSEGETIAKFTVPC